MEEVKEPTSLCPQGRPVKGSCQGKQVQSGEISLLGLHSCPKKLGFEHRISDSGPPNYNSLERDC